MTVEEVIKEMKSWPASDVSQVFDALSTQVPKKPEEKAELSPAMAEHFRKVRRIATESGVFYSDAEVVEAVRRGRG